jgi:hypothetical protein
VFGLRIEIKPAAHIIPEVRQNATMLSSEPDIQQSTPQHNCFWRSLMTEKLEMLRQACRQQPVVWAKSKLLNHRTNAVSRAAERAAQSPASVAINMPWPSAAPAPSQLGQRQ